ncbi:UNVERIFIED_CONTAM: hypothetical protein FKN15_061071 [Acipenser sinensis]
METYIRQRQLIMSPLIPSRVIGENEPLTSVFNKVIAAREVNHKGQGLWVSLKLLPGDLAQVQKDFPHLVDRGTAVVRKMGFPEIILPGNVRNDIYVTLVQGEFDKGKKKTPKNVEVMMCVLDEDGVPVQKAIFPGAGCEGISEYKSVIYYQVKQPCWNETVKVAIPIEDVCRCHLRFTFRHRSSQECEFTAVCLHEDRESRPLHSDPQHPPAVLPYSPCKFLHDTLDALFNIMMVTSEKDTYDTLVFDALVFIILLIGDIKFQHFNPVLETYITKHFSATLAYVKLTKVLNDYVGNAEDPNKTDLLFSALKALKYLSRFIVQSRILYLRFYGNSEDGDDFNNSIRKLFFSFNILMDQPLEEAVKIKGATLKYLPAIVNDLQHVFDPCELSVLLTKFIESIPDFQLVRQKLGCMCKIVESDLFKQPGRDVLLPLMTDQLSGQLDDRSQKPDYEACSQLLSNILEVLDRKDVGSCRAHVQLIMERLLRRVNRTIICMSRPSPLIDFLMETFIMFKDLIGKNVFPNDWMIMNLLQIRQVKFYIMVFLRAINQFADVLNKYFLDEANFELQLWNNYFHLTVAFLTHKSLQLETFSQEKRNKIISKYGDMRKEIGFTIRDMWYNLGPHKMKFIPAMVGSILEVTLVPEPDLRKATIPIFFDMMQCEHNSSSSRSFQALNETETMIVVDILLLFSFFQCPHKMKFIPAMVGSILEVTLVPEPDLRKATIPIFFDMMQCEHNSSSSRSFQAFENELIMKLDQEVEGGRGDEQYKVLLEKTLLEHCRRHRYLASSGETFVLLLSSLLENLLAYRTITHDESPEHRMSCTVNVLNFYKEKKREDIYIRYLYKLRDLQRASENYTEAACTLLLHAELLQWSDRPCASHLIPRDHSQVRSQQELKEYLFKEIISYFDKGKMWEKAIEHSKELARMYENEIFDFIGLSQLLKQQAQFYQNIMHAMRPQPEYFAVGYYGLGLPSFLRALVSATAAQQENTRVQQETNRIHAHQLEVAKKEMATLKARLESLVPTGPPTIVTSSI